MYRGHHASIVPSWEILYYKDIVIRVLQQVQQLPPQRSSDVTQPDQGETSSYKIRPVSLTTLATRREVQQIWHLVHIMIERTLNRPEISSGLRVALGDCKTYLLLMAEILHHLGCMKPYK